MPSEADVAAVRMALQRIHDAGSKMFNEAYLKNDERGTHYYSAYLNGIEACQKELGVWS